MANFSRVFILIIFLPTLSHTQSQDIRFERISAKQDLSKSEVTCILQDKHGFMWFGSVLGLKRFDGYKFKVYQNVPGNLTSLSNDIVKAIIEDKSGSLWIATLYGGISRFDRSIEQFTHYRVVGNNLPTNRIIRFTSILEDQSGKLWIGTDIGLCYFDRSNKVFRRYVPKPSDPAKLVHARIRILYQDQEDMIWIGTADDGLFRFDPNNQSFTHYKHDPRVENSLSNNSIESITEDNSGNLFFGTRNGLNKFDRQKNNFIRFFYQSVYSKIGAQNEIRALCPADEDLLWIASGEGFFKFDHETGIIIDIPNNPDKNQDLKTHSIKKLYMDRRGTLWIGTYTGDIFKYDPYKTKFLQFASNSEDPHGLTHNFIWGICEDSDGNLWVGTGGGGIYKLEPNQVDDSSPKWINYRYDPNSPQSISNNSVICITEDHEQALWIGTGLGLNKIIYRGINPQNFKKRKNDISFRDNIPESLKTLKYHTIQCIYEDKAKNIWIGTEQGLYKFDRKTESLFDYVSDPDNSKRLGRKSVTCIIESKTGQMWIGTYTSGFYKFDPEREEFIRYLIDPDSPYSNWIFMIYEDSMGFLWLASKRGLNKFNLETGKFIQYTSDFGLPEDDIYAILDDRDGNLWLSSVKGIFRFSPESGEVKSFDTDDGLHSMEFNIFSYYKDKQGWMYFGGINGFTAFHPDSIKYNNHIPKVVLTDFQIYNKTILPGNDSPLKKSISETKEIILTNKQSVFSFEFAALDYHSPQKNKYAYKMEGVDPDWVFTDASSRFATYTNLDPGEYIFTVKGSNNDGLWNEKGTSIKIIITPPWWRTGWAYTSYVFLSLLSIFGVWRFQTNRLKMKHQLEMEHFEAEKLREVDHLKSRFFANISHEFRTPLTLIQGPVKQMSSGEFSGNLKETSGMILRYSDRLLNLINQILDLSKLESGEMKLKVVETDIIKFIKGIVLSFSPLAESKKIILKFSCTENSLIGYIDHDKLEKIVSNLLSNAFKFTPEGGNIEVALSLRGDLATARSTKQSSSFEGEEIATSAGWQTRNDRFLLLSISNTGPGIPAEQLVKIFDRFYQADTIYKKDGEGTGIGLALTKELVEVHHGKIKVESEVNKGTTFTVCLPIEKEHFNPKEIIEEVETGKQISPLISQTEDIRYTTLDSEVQSETSVRTQDASLQSPISDIQSPVSCLRSPLLLIVEDNPDVTSYISSFMEDDYRIITAENGKEGFKKALDKYPDLIISDVMMPDMDGFELCQKIKTDERTSHVPVILLTAKADMDSKIEGLELGADDYVTKPFEARELQIRAKNLIEQRKKLREKFSALIDLNPADIAASSMDEQLLQRLLDVFEEHMEEPEFSIEQLAREIGMSRRHLYRKIKAITNLSTSDFIRILRLQRAAGMLKNASGTISEIAYKVGFNNLSHFSKTFREHFGKLPSEFTKE